MSEDGTSQPRKLKYSYLSTSTRGSKASLEERSHLPNIYKPRGIGFGYGSKTDFTKIYRHSPGPAKYKVYSEFDQNSKGGLRYVKEGDRFKHGIYDEKDPVSPGIDKYNPYPIFGQTGKQISMKPRLENPLNKNPGPGSYEFDGMGSSKHAYVLANHKKSPIPTLGTKSDRFSYIYAQGKDSPGPGYIKETVLSDSVSSLYKTRATNIGKGNRFSYQKEFGRDSPGPCTYESSADKKLKALSTVATKTTTFGVGNRFWVPSWKKTPGPGEYSIRNDYEMNLLLKSKNDYGKL